MLFGLINAPTHFQKTILMVVNLGDNWFIVYIDNILIGGGSCKEV